MIYISAIASKENTWKYQLEYSKNTWAKTLIENDILYFIFGKNDKNKFINDYNSFFNISNNIINNEIYYDVVDSFGAGRNGFNVTYKTLLDMNNFLKTNLKYYVRTHTGSYLNLNLLHQICKQLPDTNCYYGVNGKLKNYKFCSGACFVLSRDLVERICSDINFVLNLYKNNQLIDDVFFGHLLIDKYHIIPNTLNRIDILNINNFKFDKDIHHYYFVDKQKCIQENWYQIIHNKFENKKELKGTENGK